MFCFESVKLYYQNINPQKIALRTLLKAQECDIYIYINTSEFPLKGNQIKSCVLLSTLCIEQQINKI